MKKFNFIRKITRNATNKKVEENISDIVTSLISAGFSRADIAKHAGVSQTTVSTWETRNRADAAAVDRLIDSVSALQSEEPTVGIDQRDNSALWQHIKAIRALGFNVSLTPIDQF